MKTAILYARFSPRRNVEDCESIETQLELCRAYCLKNDYEIKGEYSDRALSGSDEDRPQLWLAMDDLKKGDTLMVYRLDRLARSVYLSDILERIAKKKKAAILSISGEGTWNDTDEDWLVRKILQTLAEYQRKVTAARTKAAMLRHQANGRRMGSKPPFGYTHDPDNPARMIIDNYEQDTIKIIIEQHKAGLSLRKIGQHLTDMRIQCRGKDHWHPATIQKIVKAKSFYQPELSNVTKQDLGILH